MPVYNVYGNVFYASGFDLNVIAESEAQAREIAIRLIREGASHPPRMDSEPELQEICVNNAQLAT